MGSRGFCCPLRAGSFESSITAASAGGDEPIKLSVFTVNWSTPAGK